MMKRLYGCEVSRWVAVTTWFLLIVIAVLCVISFAFDIAYHMYLGV